MFVQYQASFVIGILFTFDSLLAGRDRRAASDVDLSVLPDSN